MRASCSAGGRSVSALARRWYASTAWTSARSQAVGSAEGSTRNTQASHNPTSYADGAAFTLDTAVSPIHQALKKRRARREGCHDIADIARLEDTWHNDVAWDVTERVI